MGALVWKLTSRILIALCRCCGQLAFKSLAAQQATIIAAAQARGIEPQETPP